MEPIVYVAQRPLKAAYKALPTQAIVTDHARTCGDSPSDPFHSKVAPMAGCGVIIAIGTHAAVGGPHDAPTPGDMLCAALAACQDSAVRMVANLLGVELMYLVVEVTAVADVRGTMAMNQNVPVGFQSMTCDVRYSAKEGTSPDLLQRLHAAAERCCVVQQTLKAPPPVKTSFISEAPASSAAKQKH